MIVTETVTVTAQVPNNTAPTTPILVSPSNTSYVTVNRPNFVWEASTDLSGIDRYELSLDGSVLYSSIPTTATDNVDFTLTYDNGTLRYTLTPKTNLAEGIHTWKVRAINTNNVGTDSATWSFTVDTQSPVFVISQFGTQTVSISAQDSNTIPGSPLVLGANEPLITAAGESNSSVAVTITIPGDPTQNFNTTITSGGGWNLQLGILPRDVVMTFSAVITDLAGNVSVLNNLQFTIPSDVIIFPPATATPSPTPSATPTSSGEATPSPSPSGVPLPTLPPPSPLITIPILPPSEIANELVQETLERIPYPIQVMVSSLPAPVQESIRRSGGISNVLLSSALPIATAVAVASQFGGGLSLLVLVRILQAFGLIPAGKAQGLVYNSQTYEPIPFALLTISGKGVNQESLQETVVSDVNGIYRGIKLIAGTYTITVSHPEFSFPTKQKRPAYLPISDFYAGEPFTVTSEKSDQLFLIPMDALTQKNGQPIKNIARVRLARISKASAKLVYPLFMISGFLAILFPTLINWSIFILYALIMAGRLKDWVKIPRITGQIADTSGKPLENVVVRVSLSEGNQLVSVISSKADGSFAFFGPAAKYQITAVKAGLIWQQDNAAALSYYEADTTLQAQHVSIVMAPVSAIYDQLFS